MTSTEAKAQATPLYEAYLHSCRWYETFDQWLVRIMAK